jgi:hemoglobin/transferrin/lactoferrin receptor protein
MGRVALNVTSPCHRARRTTLALRLTAGVYNLSDEKYWNWSEVQGLSATSTVLDAYTQPGRSVRVSMTADF